MSIKYLDLQVKYHWYNADMDMTNSVKQKRVVVGMSGGVDSAVAASLLLEQGYEVHGATLKLWRMDDSASSDAELAHATASQLGIPLTVLDVQERFYKNVVSPFACDYTKGLTPNPCVYCNPTLKFAALLEHADAIGAYWIATGHYARIVHGEQASLLYRGNAAHKDQSYALHRLTQKHLRRLLLPLGEFTHKNAVRAYAEAHHIASAKAQDSQDLCFMAGGDYRSLIEEIGAAPPEPGNFVHIDGTVLGQHKGLAYYTVGQRGGLGIAWKEKLYVIRLDAEQNQVIVGPREALARQTCSLTDVSFTHQAPSERFTAQGRIRYRAPVVPIQVTMTSEASADVTFESAQYGVAPGQSLVFYHDDLVLGGGVISK